MSWCYALSSKDSEFDTAYLSIHTAVPLKARSTRVSVVNANWNDDRWNRNDYSLDNDNVWNRENRLVVRNSQLSRHILGLGNVPGFLFNVVFPTDEHLACLNEVFRDACVLRIGKYRHLPRDYQKKFREVETGDSCFK